MREDDPKDDVSRLDARLRRRVTAVLLVLGVVIAAAVFYRKTPHAETWDASAEPVGAAPEFTEVWLGAPIMDRPSVLPSPANRQFIVFDDLLDSARRRDLSGNDLGGFLQTKAPDSSWRDLLRYPGWRSIFGASEIVTDATGRFFAVAIERKLILFDLVNEAFLQPLPSARPTEPALRSAPLGRLAPARSEFRSDDGMRVVVLCTESDEEPRCEIFVGDEEPRGRRMRAVRRRTRAVNYDLEIVDAATGAVVAKRLKFIPPSDSPMHRLWAVDAEGGRLGVVRNGVVYVSTLDDSARETPMLGDGDVVVVTASPSGFFTGHQDGAVRRWRGKDSEIVVAPNGEAVASLRLVDDRIVVGTVRAERRRVVAMIGGKRLEVAGAESPEPDFRTRDWLYFSGPTGTQAIGARGSFTLPGKARSAVADWVAVDLIDSVGLFDMSGPEPRQIAQVQGSGIAPSAIQAAVGCFHVTDEFSRGVRLAKSGVLRRSPSYEGDDEPVVTRSLRAPQRVPPALPFALREALASRRLHEATPTGLLAAFVAPDDLVTYDPAAPSEMQLRVRRLDGACTFARVLFSPQGDRFVAPTWNLDGLRFGDFARGLSAAKPAPLVGPWRGAFREDRLHEGEIDGLQGAGARFAFVDNDVVAVCEPDGVRLRHVPTGRELARLADPAEALCVSTDRRTIALVKGAEVRLFQRR